MNTAATMEPGTYMGTGVAAMPTGASLVAAGLDEATWKSLVSQARKVVGASPDAEDLAQDTCLAALEASEGFEGRSTVATWLRGILRNKTHELFRQHSRVSRRGSLDEVTTGAIGAGRVPEQDEEASRHEFWSHLQAGLARMPRSLVEAYVATEIEELDTAATCRRLGITANNLWVRVHRARRFLQTVLSAEWRGGVD